MEFIGNKEGIIMDRNGSYEIILRKEKCQDCLTLLYGDEKADKRRQKDSFLQEENLPDENQLSAFYGGLAMLFVASVAIVLLLLL